MAGPRWAGANQIGEALKVNMVATASLSASALASPHCTMSETSEVVLGAGEASSAGLKTAGGVVLPVLVLELAKTSEGEDGARSAGTIVTAIEWASLVKMAGGRVYAASVLKVAKGAAGKGVTKGRGAPDSSLVETVGRAVPATVGVQFAKGKPNDVCNGIECNGTIRLLRKGAAAAIQVGCGAARFWELGAVPMCIVLCEHSRVVLGGAAHMCVVLGGAAPMCDGVAAPGNGPAGAGEAAAGSVFVSL